MKDTINKLLIDSGLPKLERIKLLTQLIAMEVDEAQFIQIPAYINHLLVNDNFPIKSTIFRTQLMLHMPPMRTKESLRRKAQRLIADLKESGTITSTGNGSETVYHLSE